MEAIILAGGFGTRLQSLVSEVPKPMAPVAGVPFLAHLAAFLEKQGVRRVVISVGYKAAVISEYFKESFLGMDIDYSPETEPLGTGGAIRRALQFIKSESCLVLNGDSLFNVRIQDLSAVHQETGATVTLSLRWMPDASRYGCVQCENGRIKAFQEKVADVGPGFINGGVYLCRSNMFEGLDLPTRFSFENDFLRPQCRKQHFAGFVSDGFFIDIGVPDDYLRAQELPFFQNSLTKTI